MESQLKEYKEKYPKLTKEQMQKNRDKHFQKTLNRYMKELGFKYF